MSFSSKIILIFCVTIIVLLTSVGITLTKFIESRFDIIEKQNISLNMNRLKEVYASELQYLSQKLSDWSSWDLTYKFIQDRNTNYVRDSISEVTLTNLAINLFVIISNTGDIVYSETITHNDERILDVPKGFKELLQKQPSIYSHINTDSVVTGLIELPEGIMLIASRPALKSDRTGSIQGSVIFGKYLGKRFQDQLAKTAHMSLAFFPTSQPLPTEIQEIYSQFLSKTDIVVQSQSEEQIGAYFLLYDLDHKPIVVVSASQRKEILLQAQESMRWLSYFLVGIGLVTTLVSLGFLQSQIYLPVKKLIEEITQLGEQKDPDFRLSKSPHKDEFLQLRQSINQTLDRLQIAQKDLAREEKRFMTYLDVANTMFVFVDTQGIIKIANKKTCEVLGRPAEKVIGQPLTEFIQLDKQQINIQSFNQMFVKEQSIIPYLERNVLNSFGEIRLIAWHNAAFYDDQKVIRGVICSGDDITEMRNEQQAKDEQWHRIKQQNDELENTKRAILNLLEDAKDLEEQLKSEKESVERKIVERTKELRENNEALQVAKKQISEGWMEIQIEKARLTASINSLSHGLLITDREQRIIMLNAKAKETLGLTTDATHIQEINIILKDSCNLIEKVTEAQLSGKVILLPELAFGSKILQITISPVTFVAHDQHEHVGTVVLIEDITEEKNLQRTRDEFFSIASHELRTPLTAIRGNTSMIMEYYKDQLKDEGLHEMIQDIYASSLRLIELVNDFLDTSRLELGKIEFKKQEVPLIELVENIVNELQATANEKQLSLSVNHSGYTSLVAVGDTEKIKQVLFNLIGNAIKFTASGSVIVHFSEIGRNAVIHITDSGKGIPVENQHLLFRKFQQAGESLYTRDATKGTGMGLYISKLMIDHMGGTIRLEKSEINKGSTFSFTLPLVSKS